MALNQYQEVVQLEDVPTHKLWEIVHAMLHHLNLEIV